MELSTLIDLGIRGDDLQVASITEKLGIPPTSGFNPAELYLGKEKVGDEIRSVTRRRPSFGVWHFSTEGLVVSPQLQDHAEFLLSKMEPVEPAIRELLQSSRYQIRLTFWHVGPGGFDLQATTIARLANLCERMSFTCFEVSDAEESEKYETE